MQCRALLMEYRALLTYSEASELLKRLLVV